MLKDRKDDSALHCEMTAKSNLVPRGEESLACLKGEGLLCHGLVASTVNRDGILDVQTTCSTWQHFLSTRNVQGELPCQRLKFDLLQKNN